MIIKLRTAQVSGALEDVIEPDNKIQLRPGDLVRGVNGTVRKFDAKESFILRLNLLFLSQVASLLQ